jgi:MgtE intracellular N domain
MLVFTRETGQSVQASDATVVGRLRDLTARLGVGHPTVHRLAIGARGHVTHLVPWSAVVAFERSGVQLGDVGPIDAFAIDSRCIPLEDDELLLGRDVLDTQIVDVVGHRLARVSDVLLTRLPDGRLELAAVDVGIGAVLRRLGLRWLSEQFPERAVDWRDLHLTSDRGHDVHLATTVAAVHRLDAHALAELLTRLDLDSATEVIKTVGPEHAAGAMALAHPEVGSRLMLALEPNDAAAVIDELPAESGHHYHHVLSSRSPLTRRRFSRLRGWRLHRPLGVGGSPPRPRRD